MFDFEGENLPVTPDFDHNEAQQRSTDVGKVSDIISRELAETRDELNDHINRDQIFGFYGDRDKKDHEFHIRI